MSTENLQQLQETVINNINEIMLETRVILNDYQKSKRFTHFFLIISLLLNISLCGYFFHFSTSQHFSNPDKEILEQKMSEIYSKNSELEFKLELIFKGLTGPSHHQVPTSYLTDGYAFLCQGNKQERGCNDHCKNYEYLSVPDTRLQYLFRQGKEDNKLRS